MNEDRVQALIEATETLCEAVKGIGKSVEQVAAVYNPLEYAGEPYKRYLERFAREKKQVLFLGMNPGPWGMAQTGVPFGEINAVRDWMGIEEPVEHPPEEHPKRKIQGFACTRSEVSGRRLWALMQERFGKAEAFFQKHLVINYCPLIFLEESGRNRTPDKLPKEERIRLQEACDDHLRSLIQITGAQQLIGIGKYAEKAFQRVAAGQFVGSVLHPSPASPAANRGWAEQAEEQLKSMGVWGL